MVYYSWIDTAVNRFLLDHGLLDLAASPVVGIVAETGCRYMSQITYPDEVTVGFRVAKLGRSPVRYAVAVFRADEDAASVDAHFVHVYVERAQHVAGADPGFHPRPPWNGSACRTEPRRERDR